MNRVILREPIDTTPPTVTGRDLTVRVATYDRLYHIGKGLERIRRGAFKDALSRPRAALRFRHVGERPGDTDAPENFYGYMTALREDGDALIAEFRVFDGEREDRLLQLVTSGAIRGVSLAAVVRESVTVPTPNGPVVDITRLGQLDSVSITPTPAYEDAEVLMVRETRAAKITAERAFWASLRSSPVGHP